MRWLVFLTLGMSSLSWSFDKTPSPDFSPSDVVEIVLGSMAKNDSPTPDAGLQQAFVFASPANKRSTGPFWHFKAIVKQPTYEPLINHTSRTLGQPEYAGTHSASIPLIVISSNGEAAGFLWSLSKQSSGDHADSWMTDSVTRIPLGPKLNAL
ncbi:MAG: hypothetical protein ACO2ZA_00975 [Litorivicinaceae bacterium]